MIRKPARPSPTRSAKAPKSASAPAARSPATTARTRQLDDYIARALPYARPILERVRDLFHQACPDIRESLKWSHPAFERQGIVGGMAAFKQHVRILFWKGKLLPDPKRLFCGPDGKSAGVLMVSELSALPPDQALLDYIRSAVELNNAGVKVPRAGAKGKAVPLAVPDDLTMALRKSKRAQSTFEALSTSQRNEYVEWLVTAKQVVTRQNRLSTTIEWLAEGKPRHWKYIKA